MTQSFQFMFVSARIEYANNYADTPSMKLSLLRMEFAHVNLSNFFVSLWV